MKLALPLALLGLLLSTIALVQSWRSTAAVKAELAQIRQTTTPSLSSIMVQVQDHAARLWASSQAGNWAYAEHSIDELDELTGAAQRHHALYDGHRLGDLFASFRKLQLASLRDAVAKKDPAAFDKAYTGLIAACNACHAQSDHSYVAIITPTAPPATNQNFKGGQ